MSARAWIWLVLAGCAAGRAAPAQPPAEVETPLVGRVPRLALAEGDAARGEGEGKDARAEAEVATSAASEATEDEGGARVEADTASFGVPASEATDEAPAPGERIPTVRVAPVTVGPKHSFAVLRRVILQHRAEFERCRVSAGEAGPAAFRFTIGAGGVVSEAEARGGDGQPSAAPGHLCAVAVLRSLKFPVDMAGLTVSYPLR